MALCVDRWTTKTILQPCEDGASLSTIEYCLILFPDNPDFYYLIFKILEDITFYFMPLTIQLTLYAFVSKHLFYGFGSALQTLHSYILLPLFVGNLY